MPYTTTNGTTTANAVEQSATASGFPVSRQDRLLRTAERIVKTLAPPPKAPTAEELAEYRQAASDTEIAVFAFSATTDENSVASKSLSGVSSRSFRSYTEAVRPIVADGMGAYFGSGGKAYISAWPR